MADPQLALVPVVILANKQDIPNVEALEAILALFRANVDKFGDRDCRIQPLCALSGYLLSCFFSFLIVGLLVS